MAQQALSGLYKAALPLAIGASIIQSSIYDVKGGTRAVIFDRYSGVKDTVVNEGTHFLIPEEHHLRCTHKAKEHLDNHRK
jgi:prohibitin 1